MRQLVLAVTTNSNGDGNATVTVSGFIADVYVVPGGGAPATVDFTLVAPPLPGVTPRTLLTGTNIGTSPVDYPVKVQAKDSTGTAISGVYDYPAVCGDLTFTVFQGGNGIVYTAYIIVLDSNARDGKRAI